MEKNSILLGIVAGILLPIIGFVVVEFLFQQMTNFGLMDSINPYTSEKRMRTLLLFALVFNLIPLHFFKNKNWLDSMRGVVFPTLIYVGYWMYKYAGSLFV